MPEASSQLPERNAYLTEGGEKCKEVRKYFKRKTRIHLSDGRVFVGFLRVSYYFYLNIQAVDSTMGVILSETIEYFFYGNYMMELLVK